MIWAVILGVVQAITEFLPVSSSAHLLVVPWLFNAQTMGLAFDAALHVGTSVALLAYFWRDFYDMIRRRDRFLWLILIALIPGATIGFLGDKFIEHTFHDGSLALVISAVGMLITTAIFWYIDSTARLKRDMQDMSWRQALVIGFAQALAFIPGTSRSGVTIITGLALGYKREAAARFSFLIGTPIALGAGLYKATSILDSSPTSSQIVQLLVGILVSGILGYIVIRWLLGYVQKHNLHVFLIYRFAFASLVLLFWWVFRR